jgi:hypothetical protein
MGLDGVPEFNIKSNNVIKEYSFWELTPIKNEKTHLKGKKKAQKILDFFG